MERVTAQRHAASEVALTTDLYELTMAASYLALGMRETATFSLFVRRLPAQRSFLVAAGLEGALARLSSFAFDRPAIEYLGSLAAIRRDALEALAELRFHGEVRAVREGRVVFADEPILEVTAPILEAQIVESAVINAIHYPTLVATKAARCVAAAEGRFLVDFGLRRTPGIAAGLAVARASFLAGFGATSNLLAGQQLAIPVAGTVAHSFIEIFPSELEAFRAFAETYPGPVTLLVDTYDTARGVAHAVEVARELSARGGTVAALRLDSGDLAALSREARRALDAAGLGAVRIFASGGLDEAGLRRLARAQAPIDGYGVGTRLGMSADSPVLDMAYKIVAYDGRPCLKLSEGKETLVGPKQVWRRRGPDGRFAGDRIAAADEPAPGEDWESLLAPVMRAGEPVPLPSLQELRSLHRAEIEALPRELLDVERRATYSVERSSVLAARQAAAVAAVRRREGLQG